MFFTTPAVMALYKPARTPAPYINRKLEGTTGKKDQLRILACVHGTRSIPALVNFVEACRGVSKKRSLKLFVMHLIELSDRTSSIMTLSRAQKDDGRKHPEDNLLVAFKAYGQISKVPVRLLTAVSELSNMHYDVCNTAAERRATIILLPFNFYRKEDGTMEHVNSGLRTFNHRVMNHAPCSIGILVDRGVWGSETLSESTISRKVAVFFFGGPDDREALTFGRRLVEHPNISLQVVRFMPNQDQLQNHVVSIVDTDDVKLDKESLSSVKEFMGNKGKDSAQAMSYEEKHYVSPTEAVLAIAKSHDFSLILVGRGHTTLVVESSELGVVGEALANASIEMNSSILVIQQHKTINDSDTPKDSS